MNILILGCSYGVPNYFGPATWPAEVHIEFLLKHQGHVVHNCSQNRGSNTNTLMRAEKYLRGEQIEHPAYSNQYVECTNVGKLDLVIWFHTETSRDMLNPAEVYQKFANFFSKIQTKVAVIGGAGDVLPEFEHFYKPDFFIPSWRRLILGKSTPLTNMLSGADWVEASGWSLNQKLKILDDALNVLDLMATSEHFPDGSHPGSWPHQDLFDRLTTAKIIT
jgi:hypothetical protein